MHVTSGAEYETTHSSLMSECAPRKIVTRSSTLVEEDDTDEYDDDESSDASTEDEAPPRKPYFVYLMACTAPQPKTEARSARRVMTHIGKSREPVRKVLRHNEGVVNQHKRNTRTTPMRWQLEEWVGPFPSRKYARDFQRSWFSKTKGAKTRIEKGLQLAKEHKVVCYTPRALEVRARSMLTTAGRKTAAQTVTL